MHRWHSHLTIIFIFSLILLGCSGGGTSEIPLAPDIQPESDLEVAASPPVVPMESVNEPSTHLWGYYDVFIDIPSQTVEYTLNRTVMFEVNVVDFINSHPVNLGFYIYDTPVEVGYVDVDVDVMLTHPFPGLPQYNGYDVRGIFIGNGYQAMDYNSDLFFALEGMDQLMLDDPDNWDGGGPDGYTRWFNPSEFTNEGLFGYITGKASTNNYSGTATLNPYKFFADGLNSHDSAFDFVATKFGVGNNVFTAGTTNRRNYYLRFPTPSPNVVFNYAIVASWAGDDPQYHPANAPEVVAGTASTEGSTVHYVNGNSNGGDIILDFSLAGYQKQPATIGIESTLLKEVKFFPAPLLIVSNGDPTYSSYHVELAAEDVNNSDDEDVWIIAEYENHDYTNEYGVMNLAGNDPLAAFFRAEVEVFDYVPSWIKVLSPNGGEEWFPGADEEIMWGSYQVTGPVNIHYSKDNFSTDIHEIALNEPNDGSFLWSNIPYDPTSTALVRISSSSDPTIFDKSNMPFTIVQPTITILSPNGGESLVPGASFEITWDSYGLTGTVDIDYSKDNFIANSNNIATGEQNDGSFMWSSVPFDPSDSVRIKISSTSYPDVFDISDANFTIEMPQIQLLIPNGGETWQVGDSEEITWSSQFLTGMINLEYSKNNFSSDVNSIATDEANDGSYLWEGIPCEMSDSVRVRVSSGSFPSVKDVSDNTFSIGGSGTVETWGGYMRDEGWAVDSDPDGNYYITGITSVAYGNYTVFLAKYSACDTLQWSKTWGGSGYDYGNGIAVDNSGNVYVTGGYTNTVDFDPSPGTDYHTSNGNIDVFLTKFNSSGIHQWAHAWGGTGVDGGYGIGIDSAGNVYVGGDFHNSVDFDPGGGYDNRDSNGAWDAYLTKFNSSGMHDWVRTWGGSNDEYNYGIAIDNSNNVYVTGNFSGSVDFDPGPQVNSHGSNGANDAYMSKFNSAGTLSWARTWGAAGADSGHKVAIDSSGNSYVTGYFSGAVDFNPGGGTNYRTSNGGIDVFLLKLSSAGTYMWVRAWGGYTSDFGYGVILDDSNNVYVVGSFWYTVDFSPGAGTDNHSSNGMSDSFKSKFNSSGTYQWARTWGGSGYDCAYGVTTNDLGDSFASGYFEGTVNFAPSGSPCNENPDNHSSAGNRDVCLNRHLPDGCW